MNAGSAESLEITLAGERVTLLADRAVWLAERAVLVVADAHLGKAEAFRALGVPVPDGPNERTLARLSALIERWRPRGLVFLGDLLHARMASGAPLARLLAAWRRGHAAVPMTLVPGNHDHAAHEVPCQAGITVAGDELALGPFRLRHHPAPVAGAHVLAGHVHPVARIAARGDALTLPCFWTRPHVTVLPAFGEFTGGARITPVAGDRIHLTDGTRVYRLARHLRRADRADSGTTSPRPPADPGQNSPTRQRRTQE